MIGVRDSGSGFSELKEAHDLEERAEKRISATEAKHSLFAVEFGTSP
jgi:hypothetical protein